MLNNISWASYIHALIISLVFYYVAVLWLYFRKDALQLFTGRNSRDANYTRIPSPSIVREEPDANAAPSMNNEKEEQIIQSLMDELNAFFEQAAKSKWVKEELMYAFQKLLQKYPDAITLQYREVISNMIRVQSEHICSVPFDEGEAEQLWLIQ